jgi:outer membrane protein, heavy metal efflux system
MLGVPLPLAVTVAICAPLATRAQPLETAADPVLDSLVREALGNSPEFSRARAAVDAEQERIPQAGALADPTLTLGIQNDGFKGIEIGKMETSFWQVMITQPLPWPGKRGLRENVARTQAKVVETQLERIRLTISAEVERAYVDLLLARGQLELLGKLDALWKEAEAITRARYEVGAVPQSDVVRAQLERTRLVQQRIALEVTERTRLQTLNRLRVHPLDEPIETSRKLTDGEDPPLPSLEEAITDAEVRSPDLAQARMSLELADGRVALARRERFPDLSVSAGIMPRGGLDPMWQASVGISLPIFSGRKQERAITESASRRDAEEQGEMALRQILLLRTRERHTVLEGLLRTSRLYRETLLVQSDAAVRSTLTQYKVGKVPFASVLEVMRGLVADEGGYLDTRAQSQRMAIAQREVSLDEPGALGSSGMRGGTVPGSSGMAASGRSQPGAGGAAAPAASGGASGMPSGM